MVSPCQAGKRQGKERRGDKKLFCPCNLNPLLTLNRVAVARAVYANPDVALFDDCLSALDAGTSQRLFDNVFANVGDDDSLLHDCGIVLVTHAIHILKQVHKIMVLDNGQCIFYGTYDELRSNDNPKLRAMHSSNDLAEHDAASSSRTVHTEQTHKEEFDAQKGELLQAEEREHGGASIWTWLLWFKYAGGIGFVLVQIILMTCDRGSYVLIDYWLAIWTSSAGQEITVFGRTFPNQYDGRSAQVPYLIVYSTIVVFMLTFLTARSQWAVFAGIRACRRVFLSMTHRVLHAPMVYFDTTPLGR